MRKLYLRALPTLAVGLLCSQRAAAGGVDTYPAPVHGEDLLLVERAHPATPHLRPFARLSLTYAKDPLVLRQNDGSEIKVIERQAGAYGSLGIGLWDRAHAALLVPVHLQSGNGAGNGGAGGSEVPGGALGDMGMDLRLAFLGREAPLEVALAARLLVPTGSEDAFVSDGYTSLAARAIVSREFGKNGLLFTGSLGTNFRENEEAEGAGTSSEMLLGLGGLLPMSEHWGVGCEGTLASQFDRFLAGTASPAGILGGVHYRKPSWVARMGAGTGLTPGVGSPDFRLVATIGSALGPAEPEARAVVQEAVDTDRDGIDDVSDACKGEAEDPDGFQDDDGCPERDNDGDGVMDSEDKCHLLAEDLDAFEDADGCPEGDNDGDGITDGKDACPTRAEDPDAFQDDDGCPDTDNDEDGVLDANDQCPSEKETLNGIQDEDGCPDLVRVERAEIRTLEPIYFERGRAQIQPRSLPLLDEMANVIVARRDLGTIAVEGHTDDLGSNAFNQNLSQQRAAAVRTYLVERGVPTERVTAAGFGEARPLENNTTKEGRERNRRVEFRLVANQGM